MVTTENGNVKPVRMNGKVNGTTHPASSKAEMPKKPVVVELAALPDLILILVPTAVLCISRTGDRKLWAIESALMADTGSVAALLVFTALLSLYLGRISPTLGGLSSFVSLVYSAVFPLTVSIGGARDSNTPSYWTQLNFVIACITIFLYYFNWTFATLATLIAPIGFVDNGLYFPMLLFVATFEAVSHTAKTSFNFEEVSLITCGIFQMLHYVANSPRLMPNEIFLPALTFGMTISIAPAIPLLRQIKHSTNPGKLAVYSYSIIVCTILLVVRPWLVAELGTDPTLWLLRYMTSKEGYEIRLLITVWWIAVLAFGILVPVKFFTASDDGDNGESLNKRRKFFHGIVVLLFLPALGLDVRHPLKHELISRASSRQLPCHWLHLYFSWPKSFETTVFRRLARNSGISFRFSWMRGIQGGLLSLVTFSYSSAVPCRFGCRCMGTLTLQIRFLLRVSAGFFVWAAVMPWYGVG